MTEGISGNILTRLIGLFDILMVIGYTAMWIYTDCCDPENDNRLENLQGMPSEMKVVYVRNSLSVAISFVVSAFLVAASCNVSWYRQLYDVFEI